MTQLWTEDTVLDGRVRLRQPKDGYRAGMDAALLAAACDARDGERVVEAGCGVGAALLASAARRPGAAFVGIRVATMNSDGNLFLLQHPVAKLVLDRKGRILNAQPAIHQSLSGFVDVEGAPPGDQLQSNKKTPFVWADEHIGSSP